MKGGHQKRTVNLEELQIVSIFGSRARKATCELFRCRLNMSETSFLSHIYIV